MFKSVNKEKNGFPVVFYEEIIAVFSEKMSHIDTENDERPKIFFQSSYAFFLIFDRLRSLHIERPQQRKNVFSR